MPDELVGESSSYSNVPRNEDEHYNSCVNEELDIEMLSNELENEPQTDEEVDIFLSENFFVEEELTIENLESQLYRCQIEEAISKNAMNKILQIFAPYVQGLPTTFTTIENHVRPTNNIVPIATQVNGDFIWLGIKEPLKRVINTGIQPGEKYFNLRQISNFCQGLPAWLSKFWNYSLIGIHLTYYFHIAFVLKVRQICRCFVAKI
jgi:hypothetical protein